METTKRTYRPIGPEELADIVRLRDKGVSLYQIAKQKDRTYPVVHYALRKYDKAPHPIVTKESTTPTPREMIKALYDMGYRIENNQLVCYQKQIVKVSDIISD